MRRLVFVPLLLTAACTTVGPDYAAPRPAALQAQGDRFLADAELTARTASSPAELASWWEGFGDPTLTRIVAHAAAANLDVEAARARLAQAEAAARGAGAARLPSLSASGRAGVTRQSTEAGPGRLLAAFPGAERTDDFYSLGTAASWELDLFGGLRRGEEAARADVEAAAAGVAGARLTVVGEAADAYMQLRTLQHRSEVLQRQVAVLSEVERLTALRVREGFAARVELDRVNAELGATRAALPLLEAGALAQLNRLDVLLGALPGTWREQLSRAEPIPTPPALAGAGGPAGLLRRRPDLIAAERRLAASTARIGVAVAEYYPSFSLGGLLGLDAAAPGRLLTGGALGGSGLLGFRWRLFDFGRVDAMVAGARGAEREALAAYRQSVLRAVEDVESAASLLVRREQQASELAGSVAALDRSRGSIRRAYAAGAVSLTDALDTERRLLAAQDEQAQARGEAARAAVLLFRSLGGGWDQSNPAG